ncbi:MAG: aspartyl/asparaginyl beta-hydroxylase domain-containing protein [Alphaproteobacteria bacterium]
MVTKQINALKTKGLDAFRRGDAKAAFDALGAAADAGAQDRDVSMGLAIVARILGRHERALSASEQVIALEPRNVEALIIKADALKGLGRERAASTFYLTAVKAAPSQGLPAPLAKDLARAQAACADAAKHYETVLRDKAAQAGFADPTGQSRVGQALDIMFGRKQIFVQQPLKFYFPELPQIQFYDSAAFDWAAALEARTQAIKEEALAVWTAGQGLEPYVPKTSDRPHLAHQTIMGNTDWTAYHLYKEGEVQSDNIARCPATMDALALPPQPAIGGNSPTALFSVLRPGMHIPPHTGMMNMRLICHLPLVVPDGCVLRVGNQERHWREGTLMVFDDSIEHEARNTSSEARIVLLFDIWRPELTEEERHFVSAIYDGIADFEDSA